MSLESIKLDVLGAFQAAAAGIHAQFANTLVQAGHPVSEASTASELINAAAAASNTVGKPVMTTTAPNYADFALHAFLTSMEQIAVQFAAAHLPDKYKPVMEQLDSGVQAALGGVSAHAATIAKDVTAAAAVAAEVAVPEAAPIIAAAEPVAETLESAVLHDEPKPEPIGHGSLTLEEPTPEPIDHGSLLHD